jgi:hypothetical protein
MAKVKFYKINNSTLSSLPKVEGQLIFVQDIGKIYIDKDNFNRVEVQAADTILSGSSSNPIANSTVTNALGNKLSTSDITVSQKLSSGVEIGSIQVGSSNPVTLYAPPTGGVNTQTASVNTTYYLTGTVNTTSTTGDQIYNTRLSNNFTGVKYETSTSAQGGRLSVDDREVTLGLFYEIA